MTTPRFIRLILLTGVAAFWVAGGAAWAETYHWVDRDGNMHFSDNPASVPRSQRDRVRVSDDITTSNPAVRASLEESGEHAARVERELRQGEVQRRIRQTREEQERTLREAREQQIRAEQARIEQQQARELRRRLDTTPIQTTVGIVGGARSGST